MGRSWEIVVWLLVFAAAAAVVIGIVRSEAAVTADDLRLSEILAGPARDWDGDGVFDSLNKYTGSGQPRGTGCLPTPASENGCPTPVSTTTWGKIKARFR